MKKFIYLYAVIFLLIAKQQNLAQCLGADPFCTGTTYTFPNSTNVANLGSVDCLGSTPNPSWYFYNTLLTVPT